MRNIEKECVKLWQACIAKMWMGMCAMQCEPGKQGTAGHHIIPRRYYLTKFELLNGIYVCIDCHNKIESDPRYEELMFQILRRKYPLVLKWHNEWRPKAKQSYDGWKLDDLRNIKNMLKEFLNDNN